LLNLFATITAKYKPQRQLHNTHKLNLGFERHLCFNP
jgi:hypothetical protein